MGGEADVADRTVRVSLVAEVNNYIAGMAKAAQATRDTGTEAQKLAQKKESFSAIGSSLLAIGAVAAVGVGLAVRSFAEFDAKMSQVKTLSHATGDEMQGLTSAALTMGQAIGFSAAQVADAEIELVKAGVSVKDILGGALKGALELASAGQIDLGQATEIATIALTQFNLTGKDVPHVADLLAAGADKALGGVGDLGYALKSGGLVAAQFGISLEETIGTLSAFANAGLIGETAGTDLRQMLLKLSAPSQQAQIDMSKLGIVLYDQQGKFVGLTALAGELHDKLGKLDDAQRNTVLATIFGSRAIAGANVLYKEGGKGIADWTKNVNDSGFAAQQAHGKMDNLNGDLSKLGAAFQNDLIAAGGSVNSVLRDIVQNLTFLVKTVADIPAPVLTVAMVLGTLVATFGLVGGGAMKAISSISNMKNALEDLKISGSTLGLALGAVGAAVSIVTFAFGAWIDSQQKAAEAAQEYADSLDQATGALTDYTRAKAFKDLNDAGAIKAAKDLGLSLDTLTNAALGNAAANHQIALAMDEWQKKNAKGQGGSDTAKLSNDWNILGAAIGSVNTKVKDGHQLWEDSVKAKANDAAATKKDSSALAELTGTAQDASGAISDLANQIQNFGKAEFDVDDTNRALHQSIDDVTSKLKQQSDAYKAAHGSLNGFNASLDVNTQEGRDNSANLEQIAKSTLAHAAAIETQTGDQQQATQAIADGRAALIKSLEQFGITGQAAEDYATKLGLVPSAIGTLVNMNDGDARAKLDGLTTAVNKLDGRTVTIYADADISQAQTAIANAMRQANLYATGGAYSTHEDGGIHAYADGGIATGIYSAGAPIYKFAEPNVRWEAFISGKPGQEQRNRQIWRDAGQRLGMGAGGGDGTTRVSLAGATILMSVDGRQMTAVIQEQIVGATRAQKAGLQSGMQEVAF